ncbi:MAG: restriction endonuclease [Chloroflexi bacterium]|nr:restriction endonuclease [Chloroflexota bacterium]
MNQENIEDIILERVYDSYFRGRNAVNLNSLCEEFGLDKTLFWNTVDYMSHQGLVKAYSMGGNYLIDFLGVLSAEEQNIGLEEIRKENQRLRTKVLDKLAKVYEESGRLADAYIESMSQEFGVDIYALANNLQILEDLSYIESVSNGSYRITFNGLDSVKEWRERVGFAGEYEQISNLKPQPRGRAIQKLLAKVIEKQGWLQEEGARTSHEEMDIVIHKEREYFLVECKWEKESIEASIVRELHGKLSNRIGVQGIIISMSGFTSGAVEQAENFASSRIILFFGKEDVEKMIFQQATFDVLLDEKYQQLITRRKIIYN